MNYKEDILVDKFHGAYLLVYCNHPFFNQN